MGILSPDMTDASTPSDPADPYAKFRALLKETYLFPADYTHKFIGKNSETFLASVKEFEAKFVGLTRTAEKQSAGGGHLALTYRFKAAEPQDIVELTIATNVIRDLLFIL